MCYNPDDLSKIHIFGTRYAQLHSRWDRVSHGNDSAENKKRWCRWRRIKRGVRQYVTTIYEGRRWKYSQWYCRCVTERKESIADKIIGRQLKRRKFERGSAESWNTWPVKKIYEKSTRIILFHGSAKPFWSLKWSMIFSAQQYVIALAWTSTEAFCHGWHIVDAKEWASRLPLPSTFWKVGTSVIIPNWTTHTGYPIY